MIETEYEPEYDQKCLCANAPIEGDGERRKKRRLGGGGKWEKKNREREAPTFLGKSPARVCALPLLPCPPLHQQVYSLFSTRVNTGFQSHFRTHFRIILPIPGIYL
jgi:hypothetical protein